MERYAARFDRRTLLLQAGNGLGSVALAVLLGAEDAGAQVRSPRRGGVSLPHYPPKARSVIQLFMSGAASQCDTFDYKPELIRRHGQKFDPGGKIELFQSDPGAVMKSPWEWKQRGNSGTWVSDLLPHLAGCVDDMALIYSMISKSNVHGPATFMQATGFVLPGFPSMGAWVSYGLGTLNKNLPDFVVLPDSRGYAPNGPANWGSGFLPASHQGTMVRAGQDPPIFDLFPPKTDIATPEADADGLKMLSRLNSEHMASRPGDSRLAARIDTYELAARLQLSAPDVLDTKSESEATKRLYGLDRPITEDFGRRCLIARRLVERGVRFVQVWSGADNGFPRRNWDSHENLARDHYDMGTSMDQPAAALIKDLKARGLLDETIVFWTTEFGRMPCSQGGAGRDHNPSAFTTWMAGGGFKGGVTYGASDEWSYKAVESPTYCYDQHATILHLLGIDHKRLTYRHDGIDRRLTDVHGHIIQELLA